MLQSRVTPASELHASTPRVAVATLFLLARSPPLLTDIGKEPWVHGQKSCHPGKASIENYALFLIFDRNSNTPELTSRIHPRGSLLLETVTIHHHLPLDAHSWARRNSGRSFQRSVPQRSLAAPDLARQHPPWSRKKEKAAPCGGFRPRTPCASQEPHSLTPARAAV